MNLSYAKASIFTFSITDEKRHADYQLSNDFCDMRPVTDVFWCAFPEFAINWNLHFTMIPVILSSLGEYLRPLLLIRINFNPSMDK